MKCVILAGGLGTRLSEETVKIPKPMVEIGGKPIIWHIMKIYAANGVTDFIVCLGYKGYVIKEYFANFFLHSSDVTIDLASGSLETANSKSEPWRVTLVDTGDNSQTGGRLKRVIPLVQDEEAFCLTYGDGVGDINVRDGIDFHRAHGKLATVTAVPPPRRFGQLEMQDNQVLNFSEKPVGDGGLINGGFFVLSPEVGKYIESDTTAWEREPLMTLTRDSELMSFEHKGFWQPMDTIRERQELEEHWATGSAPWKIWE
ncbi:MULTISPECIES: glucose-1-phosphate cytidylyltransferase [unclassified Ruegeria]|uniref:glucose-1-phosphate cytidylyltransferase n=1 Tax=unclassified Ruegeria TaxID=2625375 RepID=UPI001490F99A|nr:MULTISPECIES: glucose-1-phosphate cytidylyltransferase [unclassified Ruegeria]NOD36560.1 glucose-1-phosphate cytidylyltransferase [Ruegeria sp. HKCCD7296]NOE43800.1 glucose-1-phosphate cytidylyltransferase [Ruegeria sp. HKCCD7319]